MLIKNTKPLMDKLEQLSYTWAKCSEAMLIINQI